MKAKNRKVVLIGAGMVGMSFAYQLYSSGLVEELGLIDFFPEKAEGEAMDLNHAGALVPPIKVTSGGYEQCSDADVIVICGGLPQAPGETRLDLVDKNMKAVKEMSDQIVASGFDGVIVIASNPVDVLTNALQKFTGFPKNKIVGSGTTLDTSRFRYMLGEILDVAPNSVRGYIIGEHGDTQLAAWSNVFVYGKQFHKFLETSEKFKWEDFAQVEERVMRAAYEVINRKRATYYAIGIALFTIVKAILRDENTELAVSGYLEGQYGVDGLYIGTPAIIGREGVREIVELELSEEELTKMQHSAKVLKDTLDSAYEKLGL
ncbi:MULTISPECIES: L-lactate dehydrogenase [unclassified Gemella]|uniref:L-lactate dehydrogenase n=1 Tax=unclassified Gemella TaxID=2624949 RepID=UPI0015CFFA78|nr:MULTISPECIES: L-lactate dehydrogenase [unclassified Gemella]MBF0710383.1 L-lactate dehydrogenase [Gemella sp. GL1.1]NYS27727.1 L-lactate dehydrogenase [Gemella sp. GL1]